MFYRLIRLFLVVVPFSALAEEQPRPYFNDKKAPEDRKDLEAIQAALVRALPKAREATVCIEIGEGSGSGVIVSADGLVLTAAHVAMGVNKKVKVVMEDGTKLNALTLGVAAETDAAMVRITDPGTYPFVEMDRNATTRLGDWVFSLGHSGGFDKARGSVVRLGRLVRIAGFTWQSDCNLIGGDSGGPLFDISGRLIGIHSRVGPNLPVNMHVPMAEFVQQWDRLLKGEFIGEGPFAQRPVKGNGYLGMATEARAEGGLSITKVGAHSPAAKAGVKVGDVLLSLNGTALATRSEMQDLLKEMSAGDEVSLEIERDGSKQTLTFALGER